MIGDILKQLREQTNKTQEETAKALGIKRSAYSHFENNRNNPDNETLVKMANYFDVSTDYLLGRSTPDRKYIEQETDLDKAIDESRSFDGKPISDHDREVVKKILRGYFN